MSLEWRTFWRVSATFVDDDGARSTVTHYAEPDVGAESTASMRAYAEEWAGKATALLDSKLVSIDVSLMAFENDLALPGTSDVENKGVFIWYNEIGRSSDMALPSILESKLIDEGVAKGKYIDVTDTEVEDFTTLMIDGFDTVPLGLAGYVRPCDRNGFDFEALKDAYKQNRMSHKSQGRKG